MTVRTDIDRAVDIVCAYVSNNSIPAAELPELIAGVHRALTPVAAAPASAEDTTKPATAAQIRRSVTPDFLVSFEDGRPYKTLKRHLSTRGITPEEYRRKWGLPADYPMVAANYAAQRSELAKNIGLGRGAGRGGTVRARAA